MNRNLVGDNSASEYSSRRREYREIEVAKVHDNPYQPRVLYEDERIQSLAQSIMSQGLLIPITVRPHLNNPGEYQCASGHMRLRASKHLGHSHIPAFVENLSDIQMMEHCITENMQRENLNPIEVARGYKTLVESGHTHNEIGILVGKSRSVVSNSLRLLAMDPFLKECVLCKTLEGSKALLISTLPPEYTQYRLADIAMDWSLSHLELRDIVKAIKRGERMISWVREVPVEALIEGLPASSEAQTGSDGVESYEPVLVLMPGYVLDSKIGLDELRRLNCTKVMAEVLYMVKWLRKREEGSASVHVEISDVSIIPKPSEEQRKRMRLLCERLRTHEIQYPVGVLIHSLP